MEQMTMELIKKINHFEAEYEKAHWAYIDGLSAYQQGTITKKELRQLYELRLAALQKSQHYFNQHFNLEEAQEEAYFGEWPIPTALLKEA